MENAAHRSQSREAVAATRFTAPADAQRVRPPLFWTWRETSHATIRPAPRHRTKRSNMMPRTITPSRQPWLMLGLVAVLTCTGGCLMTSNYKRYQDAAKETNQNRIKRLAKSSNLSRLKGVAANPNTPRETLFDLIESLRRDSSLQAVRVRTEAVKNPNLTAEDLRTLYNRYPRDRGVLTGLMRRGGVPDDVMNRATPAFMRRVDRWDEQDRAERQFRREQRARKARSRARRAAAWRAMTGSGGNAPVYTSRRPSIPRRSSRRRRKCNRYPCANPAR